MRKGILALVILLVCLCIPTVSAAEEHNHCVCGGYGQGKGEHICQTVQWTPLSQVVDLNNVDWKNVPSGYYYLDGNVKVTGTTDSHAIGSSVKNADGTYTATPASVHLCLNGYSIRTTMDRVFKGIYTGSALSICDCKPRAQWGTIYGGTGSTGGIFYSYANSVIDLYGGNYTVKTPGQVAKTGGGLFYIAQDRAQPGSTDATKKDPQYACKVSIYDGNYYGGASAKNGGNFYVAHCSHLYIYGGSIHDGTAQGGSGGNLYISSTSTVSIQNAAIYNGRATSGYGNIHPVKQTYYTDNRVYGGYPEATKISSDSSREYILADALKKVPEGSYIQLQQDLETDLEISGNITLDLNGCKLSGVTVSGTLTCFDSATDSYADNAAGQIVATGNILAKEGFLPVETEGALSFHRFDLAITHISIDPNHAAFGYKSQLYGDSVVQANMVSRGYEMWLEGYPAHTYSKAAADCGSILTLRLKNIFSESNTPEQNSQNAHSDIYARAFVQLPDGSLYWSDTVSYNYRDALESADDNYAQYNADQQAALQTLAGKFSQSMMTWDVENFHHPEGGMWTALNQTNFTKYLAPDGTYYRLKAGSYVLTEDISIAARTLVIASDTTVNLCFNGHTITGSKRMLRIYGTLNLCDCHAHGEAEGGMTSTLDNETANGTVFYSFYGSTLNLYGGNLKATGAVATGGVGVTSHDGGDEHAQEPSAVMNMYGGTLSGGKAFTYVDDDEKGTIKGGKGGLLCMYNGSTLNMYGGEMFGGQADKISGALHVGNECVANLMGGAIYDSADDEGYALNYAHGQVNLGGDIRIETMHVTYDRELNTHALTSGARVHLASDVHGYLADDPALADCFVLEDGYQAVDFGGKLIAVRTGFADLSTGSGFRVGYSSLCTNPEQETGYPLSGYGNSSSRLSTQIINDLYVSATALTDEGGQTILMITCDMQRIQDDLLNWMRNHISKATGVPVEQIYISSSHSHSVPDLNSSHSLIAEYKILLQDRFVQAAVEAMATRVPATIRAAKTDAAKTQTGKYFNFSRHYFYYDAQGNIQYRGDNFGVDPSTTAEKNSMQHVTEGDHSLQVICFERQGAKDVLWCNFAAHPTMTGGSDKTVISADFIGPMRDYIQASGDYYFAYIQGASGNMNPTSRISKDMDADHNSKAEYETYGQRLGMATLNLLDNARQVPAGPLQFRRIEYTATIWKHSQEEVAKATEFNKLSYEQRQAQYKEWGYTSIFHAGSITAKDRLNDTEILEVNAFSIGNSLGFYTLPGELWSDAALEVKGNSPFEITFTVGYTNGDWKYFVGGAAADGTYENYEYFYSRFVLPTTTNELIAIWSDALNALYQN